MTNQVDETRLTDIIVEFGLAAEDKGNKGELQWKISVTYPFSQFPTNAWVDRVAGTGPPTPGQYKCLLRREALKHGKPGEELYHWNWRILSYEPVAEGSQPSNGTAAVAEGTVSRPPAASYAASENSRQSSIERQSALGRAVEMYVTCKEAYEVSGAGDSVANDTEAVLWVAEQFIGWIQGAAVSEEADAQLAAGRSGEPVESDNPALDLH